MLKLELIRLEDDLKHALLMLHKYRPKYLMMADKSLTAVLNACYVQSTIKVESKISNPAQA